MRDPLLTANCWHCWFGKRPTARGVMPSSKTPRCSGFRMFSILAEMAKMNTHVIVCNTVSDAEAWLEWL